MYIVKLMSGESFEITDSEFNNMAKASGSVLIPSLKIWINMASVSTMYPTELQEEKQDHKYGVLHDGTRVVRQFGQWFCLEGGVNEEGHSEIRPDVTYYPEVAMDCVPSPKDYEERYAALPVAERKALMCGGKDQSRYLGGGAPESIGSIMQPE